MVSEWRDTWLGDVVELKRGYDLPQGERNPGRVPVVSSSGVTDHHAVAMVKGPGVVTGRYGTLGKVFFVVEDFWPLNTTLYVRDFKGNDPRFISFFLSSLDFLAYSDKAAVPGINRNHLHQARVRLPADVGEQRAIAQILGALDDKIDLNRRINDTLQGIVETLFKSWFVAFDPVRAKAEGRNVRLPQPLSDGFPNSLVDSELGDVPKGWSVGSILDLAQLLSGGTPKTDRAEYWNGHIAWASAKDVSQAGQLFLVTTERSITQLGVDESATQILPAFCTVIVARGATTGRMVLLGTAMAMNQTCYALRSAAGTPFALYCQLRQGIDKLVHAAHGSVFDTITTNTFASSRIVLPPLSVLRAFEEIVAPLFHRVLANINESRILATLRDTLLPRLLSGELRVRDVAHLRQDDIR
jgi:type I restriction enzyme, S subunit